jgi:nucleoid-associated protein YgaU
MAERVLMQAGQRQLSLSYGAGETVTFPYNPASITFSQGVVTNPQGNTIAQSAEQAVTRVEILTFELANLRLEGKAAMRNIGLLFSWLAPEPGPPVPQAPPPPGPAPQAPPAPGASAPSPFTARIQAQRGKVLNTSAGEAPAATSGWGKRAEPGEAVKSSNQRGTSKKLTLRMGTGQGYRMGDGISGTVILKKVDVTYSRFDANGDPVRADVKLKLETVDEADPEQNPTSFSPAGGRMHVTSQGDNLQRIAQQTYQNPSAWRDIAAANGIDDPLRVRNGRTLLLPYARS